MSNLKSSDIEYKTYQSEQQLQIMMKMIESELSEPYSIYTYRYFVRNWPDLAFLAYHGENIIGVNIGKLEMHKGSKKNRGYIGMIVVLKEFRGQGIGKKLANMFIDKVKDLGGEEIVLETEVVNHGALGLYKSLGFARVKRLMNYYQNGNDAFRLKLWLTKDKEEEKNHEEEQQPKEISAN